MYIYKPKPYYEIELPYNKEFGGYRTLRIDGEYVTEEEALVIEKALQDHASKVHRQAG